MSTTGTTELTNPKAVSRVYPSVVRLTYHHGVHKRFGNGTIFSCKPDDDDNAQFVTYILTTSDFFYIPPHDQEEPVSNKIDVCLSTGELYEGEFMACDMLTKIAVVKMKSTAALPVATLTPFSDWISVSPFGASEAHAAVALSPYPTKLFLGDEVMVVSNGYLDALPLINTAIHCVDPVGSCVDAKPFIKINCPIFVNGAPVVNCEGDVIGVAFSFSFFGERAAFIPINIFFKWWKHVLTYGEIWRPMMGISITNLYAADLSDLETVVYDCGVYDGVLIDEVMCETPADSAGMLSNDVICQCDGRPVRSSLEFIEFLWDKCGEVIEVKGVRNGCHFVWEVQIEAMKTEILPEWIAKSLPENVVTRKKSTKRGRDKAKDKKKAKKGKRKRRGSDERKKGSWDLEKCSNT